MHKKLNMTQNEVWMFIQLSFTKTKIKWEARVDLEMKSDLMGFL